MTEQITSNEVRSGFDSMIENMKAAGIDPDKIAKAEVLREYFTNPEFKASLEDFTFNMEVESDS